VALVATSFFVASWHSGISGSVDRQLGLLFILGEVLIAGPNESVIVTSRPGLDQVQTRSGGKPDQVASQVKWKHLVWQKALGLAKGC
jgi:hypothetical protein